MTDYSEIQPGLYSLNTPSGPLTVTATEDELRAAGHFPASLSLHRTGATAEHSAASNTPGLLGVPRQSFSGTEVASDAAPAPAPPSATPTLVTNVAGGFKFDSGGQKEAIPGLGNALAMGAPPRADLAALDKLGRERPKSAEEREAEKLRGGGEVKQVGEGMGGEAPPPRPRFAKVGGKDIRAGFNIQRSLLDPEDVEAAELAEADASIDRKLAAQNIADRRGTQTEALSAEMGRQLRREGVALRQQEERNKAQAEDYQQRQAAIEKEREEVAKLNVNPSDLVAEGGLTGIIAAITILAGGLGATPDGRNLAKEAIQENLDRKLAQAKAKVSGKETDFDRMVKIYGSPAEAEAELRDRQRLFVQQMGQKMTTDAGATDAADMLRMQFADWDEERAQSRLARQQALAGNVSEQWAYQPERTIQVGGPRPLTPEQRRRQVRIGGSTAFTAREGDAKEIQDKVSTIEHIEEQLDRMGQIASQTGVSDVDKQRQLEALSESIGPALAVAQGQGAMSQDEADRMKSRLGNAQSFLGSGERAQTLIGETKQFFSAKKNAVVRGSVYADPDATTPLMSNRPKSVRAD